MVPPPPAAPAQQPENIVAPQHIDIKGVLGQMDKMGLSPEQKADALEGMMPMIQAAQQQELSFFKAQTQAQAAAINAYRAAMTANYQEGMLKSRKEETERKTEQGDKRLAQGQQKLDERKARIGRQAGGTGNISKWEYDPKDTTKVIGGWTKTGKHIKLDEPGVATPGKAGAGAAGAVRQSIVKAGVTNSLARLDEIEKDAKGKTTSSFFGQHAENPITRKLYGEGKSWMGADQQKVDAKWASFIDEAIPVFTGGLRGSDAFRRFLIEQAPGPGEEGSWGEKVRLLRANINGTSKAFFNKFASDPSMWAPGVTKEQVDAAKGGGAAPQQGAAPAGIPADSKVIGKSPEGKEVYEAPDGKRYTAD